MDMMEPERRFSRREEKRLLKLAAEVSLADFPNPERAGCPGPEMLRALAWRQVPLEQTEDAIDHIATCSPCFAQYMIHRQACKRRKTAQVLFLCLGIAAIIGILLTRAGWGPRPQSKRPPQFAKDLPAEQLYRQYLLDLRSQSVRRT